MGCHRQIGLGISFLLASMSLFFGILANATPTIQRISVPTTARMLCAQRYGADCDSNAKFNTIRPKLELLNYWVKTFPMINTTDVVFLPTRTELPTNLVWLRNLDLQKV